MRPLLVGLCALASAAPAQAKLVFPEPGHYAGKDFLERRVRFEFVQNRVRVSIDGFRLRDRLIMRRVPVLNGAFDTTQFGVRIMGHWSGDGRTVGTIGYRGQTVIWVATWRAASTPPFTPADGSYSGVDRFGRPIAFTLAGGRVEGFRLKGRALVGRTRLAGKRFRGERFGAVVQGRFTDASHAAGQLSYGGARASWTAALVAPS